MSKWMLPQYVSDVLPSEARKIEEMRRCILDLFRVFGYELVIPPLIEYIDSLLTGTGKDLDQQTFKVLDINSAKTLGIRADITPQIARIDAHLLGRQNITRLCYCGESLLVRPNDAQETRTPIQIGAEIYGTSNIQADVEIATLMLNCLKISGLSNIHLSIGHAGFLTLLDIDVTSSLFTYIITKNYEAIINSNHVYKELIIDLIGTHTNEQLQYLINKYPIFIPIAKDIQSIIQALSNADIIQKENIIIDITDIEGYSYHNGLTYNAHHPLNHKAVARGGRYDKVRKVLGKERDASGFSINLRNISALSHMTVHPQAILAPWHDDKDLRELIHCLRQSGRVVVQVDDMNNINLNNINNKININSNEFIIKQYIDYNSSCGWKVVNIQND